LVILGYLVCNGEETGNYNAKEGEEEMEEATVKLPSVPRPRRKSLVNALEGEDGRVMMKSKKVPDSLPQLALTRSPEAAIQAKKQENRQNWGR
jgi:hypothetical protein